jgi:UPF0042 nucleotide-binding protein
MHFVIVTGMSGAGKTTVLKIFESVGFHCVDNLPPSLIGGFAELCLDKNIRIEKASLGIDIRGGKLFNDLFSGLQTLEDMGLSYSILFLESSDEMLLQRYKETRHTHPLAIQGNISEGIAKERARLAPVKEKATYIIDTSYVLTRQLKEKIIEIFVNHAEFDSLMVHVLSFGYKYGIPRESDLVFDVRFLPNPFYIPKLKPLTGLDKDVRDFVMEHEVSRHFKESITSLLKFLIPHYVKEGKNQLIIGIGCTGGQHRSVALAHELYRSLRQAGHSVLLSHRDMGKDTAREHG